MKIKFTHSRLKDFATCPRQYEAKHITKTIKFVPSAETAEGIELHRSFEEFFLFGYCLPEKYAKYSDLLQHINTIKGEKAVEQELAVNEEYQACEFNASNYMCRGKVDLVILQKEKHRAFVFDWKSGKVSPDTQLELMALLLMAKHPWISVVKTGFVWLRFGEVTQGRVERSEEKFLWDKYKSRGSAIAIAEENATFIPKPSGLCKKHCPIVSCEFHGKSFRSSYD